MSRATRSLRAARLLAAGVVLWAGAAAAQVATLGAWSGSLAGMAIEPDGWLAIDTEDWSVRCDPAAARCQPARRHAAAPLWSTVPGPQGRGGVWALAARASDPRAGVWEVSLLYRPGGAGAARQTWPLGQSALPPERRALAVAQGHAIALLRRPDGSMQASVVPVAGGGQRQSGVSDRWTALLAAAPVGGSPLQAGVLPTGAWMAGEVREAGGPRGIWLVATGLHDGPPLRWQWSADPSDAAAMLQHAGVDAVAALPGREGGLLVLGRSRALRVSTSEPPAAAPELWIATLDVHDAASWQRPATSLGAWPDAGELRWLGWLAGAAQPTVCAELVSVGQRRLICRGLTGASLAGGAPAVSLALDSARVQDVLDGGQGQILVAALRSGETVLLRWPLPGR